MNGLTRYDVDSKNLYAVPDLKQTADRYDFIIVVLHVGVLTVEAGATKCNER